MNIKIVKSSYRFNHVIGCDIKSQEKKEKN